MEQSLWIIWGAVGGLVAGSFLATLVVRWPIGQSLSGRSRCDHCHQQLSFLDLVPLFSYLLLKRRCRKCHISIPGTHFHFEWSCALIGALAMAIAPYPMGFAGAIFGWILLTLAVLDLRHYWLPDRLTMLLLAAGLLLGLAPLADRLLGAAIGGGSLLLLSLAYKYWRKRDGLGLGDVKLMAALGAWFGPYLLAPLLLVASILGLGLAVYWHFKKQTAPSDGAIPFGACLATAAFPLWLVASSGTLLP